MQEGQEMLTHARHSSGIKQIDVVAQFGRERVLNLDHAQGQVKRSALLSIDKRFQPEPVPGRAFAWSCFPQWAWLLEDEQGLEERGVASVTPWLQPLDQERKRIVLMVQRADDGLANTA